MAGKKTMQRDIELNCSPHKLIEMFRGKQHHIPNISKDKITSVEAHHDDWTTVIETTRRWDYVLNGEAGYATERIEEVGENTLVFTILDGDLLKLYKTFVSKVEAIPKGQGCVAKWTLEYEKLNEDAPEPEAIFELIADLLKDLDDHLANDESS